MMCHAVRGTTASARKAPDLTHVGGRRRWRRGRCRTAAKSVRAGSRIRNARSPASTCRLCTAATRIGARGVGWVRPMSDATIRSRARWTALRRARKCRRGQRLGRTGWACRLSARGPPRPALLAGSATNDHKTIGRRFIVTAFVLLRRGRRARGALMRLQLATPTTGSSAPISTTSSSRCTARP